MGLSLKNVYTPYEQKIKATIPAISKGGNGENLKPTCASAKSKYKHKPLPRHHP
jgi:hypothetical protein